MVLSCHLLLLALPLLALPVLVALLAALLLALLLLLDALRSPSHDSNPCAPVTACTIPGLASLALARPLLELEPRAELAADCSAALLLPDVVTRTPPTWSPSTSPPTHSRPGAPGPLQLPAVLLLAETSPLLLPLEWWLLLPLLRPVPRATRNDELSVPLVEEVCEERRVLWLRDSSRGLPIGESCILVSLVDRFGATPEG